MKISKTFCPLPWVHQATYTDGSILLCCVSENNSKQNVNETTFRESWNSQYWKNTRKEMLAGQKPEACKRCWIEEKNGYRSHRITELGVWNERLGADALMELVKSTTDDGHLEKGIQSVDLRLGNTCNLQCVMCRPHDSSKWLGLAQKMEQLTKDPIVRGDLRYKQSIDMRNYNWQDTPDFWEQLKEVTPSIKELIIGGGEPMLLSQHFKFIAYCVENGFAKNIHLRYHTNLTHLPDSIFDIWKDFQVVEVFPSIDAIGDKNHYVRFPASWAAVENNLHKLDNSPHENIKVMILCSIHLLNFYDLNELSNWLQNQNFKKVTHGFNGYFHPGLVMHPEFLSIQVYPSNLKEIIRKKILEFEETSLRPSSKLAGVLNFMDEAEKSEFLNPALEYIFTLDQARKTNFSQTFPELSQLLGYQKFCELRSEQSLMRPGR